VERGVRDARAPGSGGRPPTTNITACTRRWIIRCRRRGAERVGIGGEAEGDAGASPGVNEFPGARGGG
jgi:hypothetical protein